MRDYLDEIRRADIRRVDNVRRDPDRVGRLLASLAVIVATGYGYVRPDGVAVIPIGALAP